MLLVKSKIFGPKKFAFKEPLHTRRLKAMTIAFLRSLIGQKVKIIQVHFTLEGEGLRAQRKYHGCLHGFLDAIL